MSTLDEAAEFFRSFFDAECKALQASLRGAASFDKLHAKMQSMLADDTVFKVNKVDVSKLSGDDAEVMEGTRKSLAPRQLFVVEEHHIGKRKFFCAIASPPRAPKKVFGYEKKFWADGSLRMVATYTACASCQGSGKVDGAKCSDCNGNGWRHITGEKIKSGKSSAVKKLLRPTRTKSAEHYDKV